MNRLFSILFFFFVVLFVNAQTKVSGQVFDASNNPVPFANVVFKGSSVGVITNEEGTFYIEDENTWDVLKISFIGFQTQEIQLEKRVTYELKVTLEEEAAALDEVVIVSGKQPKKNKEVAFVGRIVQEKGVHIFVQSIRSLVKKYPEWKFRIIGTSKAGNEKLETNYEKKVIRDFKALGHNAEYSGFIPNSEVKEIMRTLSILVVPSIWEEPFCLTALEGFCNGAAIIASEAGGLKEMLDGTGLLIEDIDVIKLEKSIASLIQNNKLMQDYQNKSWINYKYNQSQIVKKQDRIRNEIFNSYYL